VQNLLEYRMEHDYCHVSRGDNPFTARMRFHQSWYRRHVLNLPCGPNRAAGGRLYGNVLREEDGKQGYNFLNEAIHAFAEKRIQMNEGAVEPDRLRNNLLSSQPMCFNLFAALDQDLELASRLVASLPQVPKDITVTAVRLEYAPNKETHLNDRTAFDAFIEYERSGRRGFIGIESKLTEPFGPYPFPFSRPGYSRWRENPDWWWKPGAEVAFSNPQYNQLWRNHLLAFSMVHQSDLPYHEGYCAVLHHSEDQSCPKALDLYREHLNLDGMNTLLNWRLNEVLESWLPLAKTRAHRDWLNAFRLRYLDLEASRPAWEAFQVSSS
jgi:hypothetical protein